MDAAQKPFFTNIDPSLPGPVLERLNKLNSNPDYLNDKLQAISGKCSSQVRGTLIRHALSAPTATKRLFWLRREAQHVLEATTPLSACQSGCSACCNIGVMVSESEARAIGKAIGIEHQSPPEGTFVQWVEGEEFETAMARANLLSEEFFRKPCNFLSNEGSCQIYDERPIACRHQINLDEDALLCELIDGGSVPVPYFNLMDSKLAYILAMGKGSKLADIRHFFPVAR